MTGEAEAAAEPIVLRTTVGNDVCMALMGLIALSAAYVLGQCILEFIAPKTVPGGDYVSPALLLLAAPLGYWPGFTSVGGIWRLVDRSPSVFADSTGIRLHPSLGPRFTAWSAVASVRALRDRPFRIEIEFSRPFWSTNNLLFTTKTRLISRGVGMSTKELAAAVTWMRKWLPAG